MEIWLQIGAGLALLALGGEGVVRGAIGVARKLGVSELLIGLTLVGFGTSTPELLTSVNAAFAGSPGIAVGNVVGSNIGNILLIFAIVMLVKPVVVSPASVRRDGYVMLAVSALFVAVAVTIGELSRLVGGVFLLGLVAYIIVTWVLERRQTAIAETSAELHAAEVKAREPGGMSLLISFAFAAGGLALLIFGADLLVQGAVSLAQLAGLSETVIGLTIVAVGTSLPELVASLAAALKGRSDVAVGNIVGSNIYNILGILGLTAVIQPIAIPDDMVWRDWIALMAAASVLVFVAQRFGHFGRLLGLGLLVAYAAYSYLLVNPQALQLAG